MYKSYDKIVNFMYSCYEFVINEATDSSNLRFIIKDKVWNIVTSSDRIANSNNIIFECDNQTIANISIKDSNIGISNYINTVSKYKWGKSWELTRKTIEI